MMRVDFTFHYHDGSEAGAERYDVPEASSEHFTSLFNCDAAVLRSDELWKSFVREYRDSSRTFQNWLTEQSEDDWQEFLQHSNGGGAGENGMFWGPSAPFAPQEARDWAQAWIEVLEPLSAQELQLLFPLYADPHSLESRFDKVATVNALCHVIAQAGCAEQNKVQLTVDMALH